MLQPTTLVSSLSISQDTKTAIDHDKGEICNFGALSPLDFFWIFSSGFLSLFSRLTVQFSKEISAQNGGKIARFPGGGKSVESCDVSGCHGFFGPASIRTHLGGPFLGISILSSSFLAPLWEGQSGSRSPFRRNIVGEWMHAGQICKTAWFRSNFQEPLQIWIY